MTLAPPIRSMLFLGVVGLGAVLLLAAVNEVTEDRIADQSRRAAHQALLEVLPESPHDNDPVTDTLEFPRRDSGGTTVVHRAFRDGELVGAALAVTARNGYSGPIELLVGVHPDGRVAAVRVVSHRETPGLGDGIELRRSDWIRQFEGASLTNPPAEDWKPDRRDGDFDTLTGATITSSAVIGAIREALLLYDARREQIGTPEA